MTSILKPKAKNTQDGTGHKKVAPNLVPSFLQMIENQFLCRGDWIRTSDLQLPKLAR